ncbi:MAG: DUF975 family protein [Bacteroidales bacterium]|nr:DUF975 family protein [Bacteroidales bacterium]
MKTYSEYKTAARTALRDHWGMAAVTALIYGVLTGFCHGFPALGFFLIALPLSVGFAGTFRRLLTNGDSELVDNLFEISIKDYLHTMATMALRSIYIFLWTLLLIVPGIIKSLSYAMVPYLVKDRPELSADQTIDLSVQMMEGHKSELFGLYLSFFGWFVLCLLTCGIGFIFLKPYVSTSVADFYEDLKAGLPTYQAR